ncbi:MAG: hypothetical protein AAGA48_13200 [Myxococcota bacterium]
MRISGWLWLALVGCSGEAPPEEEEDPIVGNDTGPDFNPPPPPSRIDAAVLLFEGFGAWDPEEEMWVSTAEGNGLAAQSPGVLLTILDSSFERGCQVFVTTDEPMLPPADWVEDRGTILGFEINPDNAVVIDGCADFELPGEFGGDVGSMAARWTWGLGVAPLNDETRDLLEDSLAASEWDALRDLVVGATLYSNLFTLLDDDEDFFDLATTRGFEMDEKFVVDVGGTGDLQNVDAEDILLKDGEVGRAFYTFESYQGITPATLLTAEVPMPGETGATGDTAVP